MSKYIPGNQKHLTIEDRIYIQNELDKGTSFKDIARFLCKDPTTISKEVKARRASDWFHKGTFLNAKNFCTKRFRCKKTNACNKILLCGVKCASCPTCNQTCPDFQKERCSKLDRAPYVCNGCSKKINQGQSPYQIVANHPELNLSVRSVYNYLDMGLLTARNVDLKRKVKFKPRKVHKSQISDRRVFNGRTYADFQQLQLESFVEMDTVHSAVGSSKTLLTFFFTREKLFLAFLMNRNTEGSVRLVFDRLEKRFGTFDFLTLFEYILTDRGAEFGDPDSLETGVTGIQRTNIYYCDPMRSGQKGGIEQAHTMLRMILPKRTTFEFLTQWDVNLITSHINSTPRESLNGRTPYDVALEAFGEDVLKAFQLRRIDPDKVILTPKLIRYNH